MEPVPSSVLKIYPARGPLQQFRFVESTAFRCFRCGENKKSKLLSGSDWSKRLCNGCYGRLLSLYEIKAGTIADDQRADKLADALLSMVEYNNQQEAERLFRASETRAIALSSDALRFIVTAEHVAGQLEGFPQLEWSPAVIGLCKAVEAEVVRRILLPLATTAGGEDLSSDKQDKDVGRVAAFCADTSRKPPELGVFAYFLQTVIHSRERRVSSAIVGSFLRLAGEWTGSNWVLDPEAFHHLLEVLIKNFRNRAAHIDELSREDYVGCRELVIGSEGILWRLLLSTERVR